MKVFVTGMGLISAIGNNVAENLRSLKNTKTGIAKAEFLQSNYTSSILFGEVKKSNAELIKLTDSTSESGLTRTTLLSYVAVLESVADAKLNSNEIQSFETGFISSSTVEGMTHADELYSDTNLTGEPSEFVHSFGSGEHVHRVAKKLGIKGITSSINTACSSSANAIMFGARLIKSGRLNRVIVGGSDALAKFTVNGFNSLMILTDEPCRPFDIDRKGLNLGEGAGYLVLEAESVCKGKKKYAEITGYGNANDAHHPSATSPEANGPKLAMQRALKIAKINPSEIDYINAHGTGTVNNDETELFAFSSVFEKTPPFNSTKSYTGHTLAASGAIESILSILSMNESELYPSLNCETPIGVAPISKIEKATIKTIMSNSFGFGGNCTSLVLKAVEKV
ncbi:MAG: beta-ketoacyl-[acyl-carrier-protein] synthase family protein [Fluviicola sp.]|nr:beta-ketoacyl-[acyl-carrier-protein] synthase family protein [Fluviicola sp.]